tara:strand:- start:3010 stop:4644 length:1635 start_codon:yes stop_codon:yes gene_type:complete
MSLNFFIFFLSYLIILISIFGYGSFILSFENNKKDYFNLGQIGLVGIFFLIIYSYSSNIFIAHSKTHNILFILIGVLFFFYFLKKNFDKQNFKKDFVYLGIIFLILFFSLLIKKNHDDFPYYHFAYTYNLTQESLNFGIGKFNHGFRTPSSIFYLNSLFYLPYVEYYLFNFSSVFIMGFSNFILIKKIFKFNYKNNQIVFSNYLSLLSFIFINIFFYRISEHGTDRSAQILVLVLFVYFLDYFYKKKNLKDDLIIIYVLFGLIISLKSFYFLYILFLIPFFLFINNNCKNFFSSIKILLHNKYFYYLICLISLILLSYFSNTGCLLYPVHFTCFENYAWSIPSNNVKLMNDWYELWSKAGANPNFRVDNPNQYIIGFNWLSNWINNYFFTKVTDFILGIFLILIIIYLFFIKFKKKNKVKISKFIYITYLILILLFFEWFYNHPALRYGGYCIIALLIFVPFSFYLSKSQINIKKFHKIALILILLTVTIFETRNINRLLKEINLYDYKPFSETFYSIDDSYFNLHYIMKDLKNKNGIFSKTIY